MAEGFQTDATDEQLMAGVALGHPGAFGELFARYKGPVFGFFQRRIADPARAEELAQETFLAILRGASRYKPSALFRTYLYAIALNLVRGDRRKAAFRATFLGVRTEDADPGARSTVELDVMLRHAVGKLDEVDREVLLLREFEELGYAEIAEVLGLPVNTVRSRLFRARAALKELLTARPDAVSKAKERV